MARIKKPRTFVLKSFLIAVLRRASYRYPSRSEALRAAKKAYNWYQCAQCRKEYVRKDVQVDHIQPLVDPASGFTSWDTFIARLFVGIEGLQVLCKPCHKIKTQAENAERRKYRVK
jgi:5-methylcytosine-specific restriction endonuclease McrA